MIMKNTIAISKAAEMVGVTVKTLQRWEREGRLVPVARNACPGWWELALPKS